MACCPSYLRIYVFTVYLAHPIPHCTPMSKNSTDRHKDHSRQYNVRIPTPLREAFHAACKERDLLPAQVVRTLMQGFVDVAADEKGRPTS